MPNYIWTAEEEFRACYFYLNYATQSCRKRRFAEKLTNDLRLSISTLFPHIPEEEVEAELKRIKKLCHICGFEDELMLEPLSGYTEQCRQALSQAIDKFLSVLDEIDPRPLDGIRRESKREKELADENGYILLSRDCFDTGIIDQCDLHYDIEPVRKKRPRRPRPVRKQD